MAAEVENPYHDTVEDEPAISPDYSYVKATARVAVYDDMRMPPHVIEIKPAPTADFIEHLATCINDEKMKLGGKIPYGAIREVAENFIHARFTEVVVSILDEGNTIRFCDQGPGIGNKEKATLPGFTSASEPMKHYIRGVGSGLPLVKEYLDISGGCISIEDNIRSGSVVTITLKQDEQDKTPVQNTVQREHDPEPVAPKAVRIPPLSDRELHALELFVEKGALGNKDIVEGLSIANSSANATLKKMEAAGLVEVIANKKRTLTDYGFAVYEQLSR